MSTSIELQHDDALVLLTRARAAQLGWLHAKFGATFTGHDLEELLQEAYLRAIVSLDGPNPPAFDGPEALSAWFRVVMSNTAVDAVRTRDGRSETAKAARPVLVPLVADDDAPAPLTADDDVEERVLAAAERDHAQVAVVRALAELPDDHVRILQWRFMENLEPRAIMRRERLDTVKVYEGRLTRAIKALGRALSRIDLGVGCGEARHLLEQRPDLLLERAAGAARVHLDACAACMAFSRRLRGALGALPLSPVALGLPSGAGATGQAVPAAVEPSQHGLLHGILSHPKVVAGLLAGVVATGGGAAVAASGSSEPAAAAPVGHATPLTMPALAPPYSDSVRARPMP